MTLTGNKGGTSMLYAALDELGDDDGVAFDLISVYPDEDSRENTISELRIVSARPLVLLMHLPAALALFPAARFRLGRRLLGISPIFRSYLAADVVVDMSGIAFSDGRGLPTLAYNLAVCLPPALLGRPVVKVSQALGPFQEPLNRFFAGLALRRMAFVVGRGRRSGEHLAELGVREAKVLPDTAFAMKVDPGARKEARALLDREKLNRPLVVVCPSQVVDTHCRRKGIDYGREMALFVAHLVRRGRAVAIVAHSTVSDGERNNDVSISRAIARAVAEQGLEVAVFDRDLDARVLRAIIGEADLFVGSRFHSMISALATGTPPLIIGWGHKYREVLERFGLSDLAMDWSEVDHRGLASAFEALEARAAPIRRQIAEALPEVVAEARANFELVMSACQAPPAVA